MNVAVCLVTYGSADDLPGCFAALAAQDHRPFEVVVVDCNSTDASVAVAREAELPEDIGRTVVPLGENRGFSGGMNAAFARTDAPFLLTLNADARPAPDFLRRLLERLADERFARERFAAVTGRLVRPAKSDGAKSDGTRLLDACGMHLVPTWRHLDRGSGEPDDGRYATPERVFGGTGAATLWRRAALDDAALTKGEIFDPAFHSFREDAELCFRLQARGWEVVYEPAAVCEHHRRVLPARRRELPAAINYHSLKNRYLLRAYHQTAGNFLRTLVPTLWRDLLALGYVLAVERTSLPAYGWLWKHRRDILDRRRRLRERCISPKAVERWFTQPALPLPSENA